MASRDFMTSVVVGKDAVPRIGMHQAETLRLLVMRITLVVWVVITRVVAIQRHFRGDIFQDTGTLHIRVALSEYF